MARKQKPLADPIIRRLIAFGLAFPIGFMDMQLLAIWDRSEWAIPGGVFLGTVCGILWILLLPFLEQMTWRQAVLLGIAFPAIVCVLSVVGICFLGYVLVAWFIFLPSGALLGFATHRILVR